MIPSQLPLLEGIGRNFAALEKAGCTSLGALRARLKNAKALAALSQASRVDPDYLALLRRAVEGFFPKPVNLDVFDWLAAQTREKLGMTGICNTAQLYDVAASGLAALAKKSGLSVKALAEPVALADLSRVQWVSPTFARALVTAGFTSAAKLAAADPETVFEALQTANAGARFYKGMIGLRDIKRLVAAASHLSD